MVTFLQLNRFVCGHSLHGGQYITSLSQESCVRKKNVSFAGQQVFMNLQGTSCHKRQIGSNLLVTHAVLARSYRVSFHNLIKLARCRVFGIEFPLAHMILTFSCMMSRPGKNLNTSNRAIQPCFENEVCSISFHSKLQRIVLYNKYIVAYYSKFRN